MDDKYRQAQLTKLGFNPYECYQFGFLFRELAAYKTQLSTESVTDKEAEARHKELLAKKSLIGVVQPTNEEIKQSLIERLTYDFDLLELKRLQLDLLKSAIEADLANVGAEMAKVEAIIEHIKHD